MNTEPLTTIYAVAAAFKSMTLRSFHYAESNLVAVGTCGAIGMPLYYFIWNDLFPQPYENLPLRLVGGALCLVLALKNYLPQVLRRYLPVIWYISILYVLPFFFTFMLLKNGSSSVWLVSSISALLLLILLVDWINLIILSALGTLMAWVAFALTTDGPKGLDLYYENLPVFLFALVAGTIFSYRRDLLKEERLDAMLSVSSNIARELRAPLMGIKTSAAGLKQYLPVLLRTYELAKEKGLPVIDIPATHRTALEHTLERVQTDMSRANTIIEMLLRNTGAIPIETDVFRVHSIADCVDAAIRRYPFTSEKERNIIKLRMNSDFGFHGSDIVMIHVLLNLIKSGLTAIARAGKGEITIQTDCLDDRNRLRFRHTGGAASPNTLLRIFDEYASLEAGSGTGPGLAFAKKAMEHFGGKMSCRSEPGKYTEFVLTFPVLPAPDSA